MTVTAGLTIMDGETGRALEVADLKDETVVAAVEAASTAIVSAITLARTTQSSAMAAALTELGQKLEPADITALSTAANQTTEITALGSLLTELAQKLEPADLAALATAAHQVTTDGKLDALLTELAQKLEPADVASLSTAANQVSTNSKLDTALTELQQKLEPADIALLATAAKQDSAKAVFDTMSTTLSSIAGYVDGLEAAEASNLAKLEAIRLLQVGTALDGTDITTPTAMPTGGVGIRGWLSAIWTKLNGTLLVESSTALITAATYFSTGDARNGLTSTYTQQRGSQTRTVTVTRDTTTGAVTAQSATAWA